MTKTIGDNYRIYNLIIISNEGIVANVRCGLFKMSNMNHLTMLLPHMKIFLFENLNHLITRDFWMVKI
jgi:hypothetical protein